MYVFPVLTTESHSASQLYSPSSSRSRSWRWSRDSPSWGCVLWRVLWSCSVLLQVRVGGWRHPEALQVNTRPKPRSAADTWGLSSTRSGWAEQPNNVQNENQKHDQVPTPHRDSECPQREQTLVCIMKNVFKLFTTCNLSNTVWYVTNFWNVPVKQLLFVRNVPAVILHFLKGC